MAEDLSILTRQARAPDRTLTYGTGTDQVADIRYGRRGGQLPLVVLIHGGFWKPQYDRTHTQAMSSALADAGWTVLTLEYRRIPGDPDATLQDITTALQALPGRVDQHNGRVLLMGHSAGGHLVLWAAAKMATPALSFLSTLQGVVALAPVADLRLAYGLGLGNEAVKNFLGGDPQGRPDADPMRLPAPTVAVTIVQGDDDQVVPPAVAQSYLGAFPGTRLVGLANAGHFALIDPLTPAWRVVVQTLQKLSD
ncbi:MAG: hypothetical protein RIS34_1332 [Pseudomonadota bacterium]|jgi:acetyl esterase/lipase